jgi:hypothetical protein
MAAVDWNAGDSITGTKLQAMEVGHLVVPSFSTSVTNTTTETEFAELTIPANEAEVGTCWRLKAWGAWAVTGTPTLNVKLRVGASATASANTQQAQTGALTAQSGVTNRLWIAEFDLCCEAVGVAGTVNGPMKVKTAGILAGTAPFINDAAEITTVMDGTASTTIDTTAANYASLTVTWSAASASNIFLCKGFIAQKLVG